MGNDLYWLPTPKPKEEQTYGLTMFTWHFLAEYFDYTDIDNLEGVTLDKDRLRHLGLMKLTATACGNKMLMNDLQELIDGIIKYDSITLTIKG